MKKDPLVSMIVAVDKNRGIGSDEKLLWDIPEDRKRFKDITLGHPVILGRKTFESILSYIKKPLPDRTNIIITRDENTFFKRHPELGHSAELSRSLSGSRNEFGMTPIVICHSIEEAIKKAKEIDKEEIFIGGGGMIYKLALPYTDRIYLTLVDGEYPEADTFFFDYSEFKKVLHEEELISSKGVKYKFMIIER